MNRLEVIKSLGRGLRDRGFSAKGRVFTFEHPDMLWLVDLEQIPRTDRVGVSVGVCPDLLMAERRPARANDCPIIFHPESSDEPFGIDRWQTWQALDLGSDLGDLERAEALNELVASIVDLASGVATVHDLKLLASEGKIRGFVRKDARALLM